MISFLAYRTDIGSFTEPGAGFVAFASGLFIMAVGALITVFRRPGWDNLNLQLRPCRQRIE